MNTLVPLVRPLSSRGITPIPRESPASLGSADHAECGEWKMSKCRGQSNRLRRMQSPSRKQKALRKRQNRARFHPTSGIAIIRKSFREAAERDHVPVKLPNRIMPVLRFVWSHPTLAEAFDQKPRVNEDLNLQRLKAMHDKLKSLPNNLETNLRLRSLNQKDR